MIVHAGLVALLHKERWHGALITGPSGAGKSDLALRLIDLGLVLVADDRTVLWTSGGHLFGRAADALAGKVEARGLGVLESPYLGHCRVDLVCDLAGAVERMPEPMVENLLGIEVSKVALAPFEASAPAKLSRWLMGLG